MSFVIGVFIFICLIFSVQSRITGVWYDLVARTKTPGSHVGTTRTQQGEKDEREREYQANNPQSKKIRRIHATLGQVRTGQVRLSHTANESQK